jgi:hypothetical protein
MPTRCAETHPRRLTASRELLSLSVVPLPAEATRPADSEVRNESEARSMICAHLRANGVAAAIPLKLKLHGLQNGGNV